MSASYGDQDLFSLIGMWFRYRLFRRRDQKQLRAIELEFDSHAGNILRCVLADEAQRIVPADLPIPNPEHTLLVADLSREDAIRLRRLRGR